jgi:hypothetical protein
LEKEGIIAESKADREAGETGKMNKMTNEGLSQKIQLLKELDAKNVKEMRLRHVLPVSLGEEVRGEHCRLSDGAPRLMLFALQGSQAKYPEFQAELDALAASMQDL